MDIQFENNKGQTLRGYVRNPKSRSAVLFLHGFPSHATGYTVRTSSRFLSWMGHMVMAFNFSGVNTSDGKFEDKTFTQELEDTKAAIDFMEKNFAYDQLALIGHSGGAVDGALFSDKRIDKKILISGPSDLEETIPLEFTPEQIGSFEKNGYIIYDRPGKWYHKKKLKRQMYDEMFKHDIKGAIAKNDKPLLIIHGSKDTLIPVEHAYELYQAAGNPKELKIIQGADHRFSNPWHKMQLLWAIHRFL